MCSITGTGALVNGGTCSPCEASFYNNGSSQFCASCPLGKASAVGAYSCSVPPLKCNNGLYYYLAGGYCTYNFYANVYCYGGRCLDSYASCSSGLSTGGTWSTYSGSPYYQEASSCTGSTTKSCPAGTGKISPSSAGCYSCQYSQFNNGSSLYCSSCPSGSVPSTDLSSCVRLCPAGKDGCMNISDECM